MDRAHPFNPVRILQSSSTSGRYEADGSLVALYTLLPESLAATIDA